MTLTLTDEQLAAVSACADWYATGATDVFALSGYAGTGKTTIARHIVAELQAQPVRYAAFTGKAASVLAAKGCDPVSTIHSLIYMPRAQARAALRAMRERLNAEKDRPVRDGPAIRELQDQIRVAHDRLSSPTFTLRAPRESTLTGSQLLVVDESSMVNRTIAADLTSFGVPILAIGDPAQLPPVDGDGWLTGNEPGACLTTPHRAALGSPVTRVATAVRMAVPGERGYGVREVDNGSGRVPELSPGALRMADQILCGTNQTRWQGIRLIRRWLGHDPRCPVPGDRVICLANSGELDIYNGQQMTVVNVEDRDRERYDLLVRSDDDGTILDMPVWRYGFESPDGERHARIFGTGDTAALTYSYLITVHKAQGSQWPRVLVIDESHVFERMHGGTPEERYQAGQRWLYTAVTRASEQVVITGTGIVRG